MRNIFILPFLFIASLLVGQSSFTAEDAIDVESLSQIQLSPDGAYLVGIKAAGYKNRFGRDHFRFRDPSYITPYSGELLIYPTAGGPAISPLKASTHVMNPTWSKDGQQLAFLKIEGEKVRLAIYHMRQGRLRFIPLKTNKTIATNSDLFWMDQNRSIGLNLRSENWLKKGMALYKEANEGPITVYDGEEPFLKWDAIGNQANLSIPATVDVNNGNTNELLPEGNYDNFHAYEMAGQLIYRENTPLKTSYNRRDGNAMVWKMIDWNTPSDNTTLFPSTKERKSYTFSRDNRWMAWADDGHIKVRQVLDTNILNLTKDKNILVAEDSATVKFTPVTWNRDASQLIASSKYGMWIIDRVSGSVDRFLEYNPENKKAPTYRALGWDENSRYLYLNYQAKDRWERGVFRYDFRRNRMEELLKSDQLYRNFQLSKDGSTFAYSLSDGDRPDDYYVANAKLEKPKKITDLNPWTKQKKFTKSELIKYLDADGNELYGILYYPVDYVAGKKYPLVCEIYESFFDNGYRASMNIIANKGYFGFRPSVSLEEGRPGVAWIKGVTAGVNKIIEMGLADPDKVGIHGTSYGGYAASLLVAQTNRFAAAINISGKTNMVSFLGDSPKIGTRNYAAAEVGQDRIGESLWEAPMKYMEHSAIMYADKINTPHLLLTGEGDWNVPAANTRELYYALRRLGKKVTWVNYKNAGHGAGWAGSKSDYLDQWERMFNWYAEHFEATGKKTLKP